MGNIVVVGSVNIDLVVAAQRFPQTGETVTGSDLQMIPGGKGANQACAAAMLRADMKAPGSKTYMIAHVGNDAFGEQSLESLNQAGVDTSLVAKVSRSTGVAMITVGPKGDNTIVLAPGANATLDPASALTALPQLKPSDIVLLQLEVPLKTVLAVVERAKQQGAIVILDPAPFQPLPGALLRQVDYLTPNQTEAAALLGVPESELQPMDSIQRAAAKIHSTGPAAVLLKLGAQGCWLQTPTRSEAIAGFAVQAIDTTAAGDTCNAAFAVALSEGRTPQQAARFANAAAALSVTKVGAQSSIPNRAAVDAFLAGQSQS